MATMPKTTVYSTTTCPWCVKAKNYLKKSGVEFVDKDVTFDQKAQQEMIDKSGQMGVPVLDINGKIIVGFNQDDIDQALEK